MIKIITLYLRGRDCLCKYIYDKKTKNINPYLCNLGLACKFPHSIYERNQWRFYWNKNINQNLPSIFSFNSNNLYNVRTSPSVSPINDISNKKRKASLNDSLLENPNKKTLVIKPTKEDNDINKSKINKVVSTNTNEIKEQFIDKNTIINSDGLNIINRAISLDQKNNSLDQKKNNSIFKYDEKEKR